MPTNKDLKRLTRSRMRKTGESYTTARSHLIDKKNRPAAVVPPKPDFASLAGMSDDAVQAKTGCTWEKWVRVLDAIDASSMAHREIARYVLDKFEISGLVGPDGHRGLRADPRPP